MDDESIIKESVKICQCGFCNGLSCFKCWKSLASQKDPICPKCSFRIDIPEKGKADPTPYLKVCSQKILLNLLFKEMIIHDCPTARATAFERAEEILENEL